VIHAFQMGEKSIVSATALDAWSLGVMAFELLTGSPAFRLVTDGRTKVRRAVFLLAKLVVSRVHGLTRSCGCTESVV
jgi:serine/threonine protein kinase